MDTNEDVMTLIAARHSVRQYVDHPIEQEKRDILDREAARCNQESGLHIQVMYDEPTCFQGRMARYGSFSGVTDYIAMVGPKGGDLDVKAGYYGERLVLLAQKLGLNTCWVGLTHGKTKAEILPGEKLVVVIALGYGATQGVAHRVKPVEEISNSAEDAPAWFQTGVVAAQLAPTAVNQQKFFIKREGDKAVLRVKGIGSYTKVDLGIVRCHFEAVSGHEVIVDA
jgi:hypothetical protein